MNKSKVHNYKRISTKNRSHKRHSDDPRRPHKDGGNHVRLVIVHQCILCGDVTNDIWMFHESDLSFQDGSSEQQKPTKYALCDSCAERPDRIELVESEIKAQRNIFGGPKIDFSRRKEFFGGDVP